MSRARAMDAADRALLEVLCLEIVHGAYTAHRIRRTWDARAPEPVETVASIADDLLSNRGFGRKYTRVTVTAEARLATARLVRAGALARSRASGARGVECWAFEPPPVANPAVRFDVKLEQRGYVEIAIRMLRGSKKIGQFAGSEYRRARRDELLAGRCGPALLAAEREVGRPLRVFLAYNTAVLDAEKGTGLGAELYAQAILAAAKLGGVLVRADCTGWIGTSAEARRVWASKRLRERFAFFGDAVAYGGAEIPPGCRQVERVVGRGLAVANPARRRASSLLERLDVLRPAIARAAQTVYDRWEQDAEGLSEDHGEGGICDEVASAIGSVVGRLRGVDTTDGGQDGDDHAYIIVLTRSEAVAVDIPPRVYEIGGGYSWRKRRGVVIGADDVTLDTLRRSDFDD